MNTYAYVGGNPLSYFDPLGLRVNPHPNGIRRYPKAVQNRNAAILAGGIATVSAYLALGPMAPIAATMLELGYLATGEIPLGKLGSCPIKNTGDLTKKEIKLIQDVVNEAGRPLEVVGSAAKGTRRGIGSELPIGKGNGTKSDIDVLIPPSSKYHFNGLTNNLPDADVNIE